nr:LPS export ABC transporter permease LptF [Shimia biformata]
MSRQSQRLIGGFWKVSRFDRYLLSQFLVLFGFFALVLVAVYWVNRAVILFDRLIADGQPASVFIEFTALSLPKVIQLVLPMATFAATVYATNRLTSESELTVMQATGFSPWRLSRPVAYFGILVGLMMAILTNVLVPASVTELTKRQKEIAENVTSRLLTEGTFIHPADGVTFYIREITPTGVLKDIYLSDRRQDTQATTYTAAEAYLVKSETGPKLIMVDGLAQVHVEDGERLYTTRFSDFSYDISALLDERPLGIQRLDEFGTLELLRSAEKIAADLDETVGAVMEEAHTRIALPLLCVVVALIGFATLLVGGYSRFGVWRQIAVAFVLLVVLEGTKSSMIDPVRGNGDLWPLIYLSPALGFGIALSLLTLAAHPLRLRRRAVT